MTVHLRADEPAPDFSVADHLGRPVNLTSLRESGRVVLVFLRYVGCPVCQMRFHELQASRAQYESRGARLVVVIQSDAAALRAHHAKRPFDLTVLPDPGKELFSLYGVERATWGEYAAPAALGRAAKATLAGYWHGRFDGDERQKPADFVIDRDGRLLFVNYGRHIADNATDRVLWDVLDAAR